jgi:alpha-galactosidase
VEEMRALVGLGTLVTNVNLPNSGQIADLPLGAVVETNALISHDEVRPIAAGSLPPQIAALVARHVANQELIVEAALARDLRLAFSAVYNDPASALPVDEAWEMFREMLRGSHQFLAGWEIP